MLTVVQGDLCIAQEEYICQQCNCISTRPHGLSKTIADRFGVDPYSRRRSLNGRNYAVLEDRSAPGSIQVIDRVICMFAQYGMGKPHSYGNRVEDSHRSRLLWFYECLYRIGEMGPKSIAMPYNIGCGLAGGNWERDYYPAIKYFSEKYPEIKVVLYRL